jgi:hypothetical protein
MFPQRWRFVPEWARNAGFNLVVLPHWLNNRMGRTYGAWSVRWLFWRGGVENAIRIAIPGTVAGGVYGAYQLGQSLDELDESPAPNPRVPEHRRSQAQPMP